MKKNSSIFIIFLALGVFGIITTEMGIIGVLPQAADRFHITASKAGWLVSVFALVVAVSGPFLTLLASGLNRKYILLLAVLMFAVSNTVYAYTVHFMVRHVVCPAGFRIDDGATGLGKQKTRRKLRSTESGLLPGLFMTGAHA